MKCGQLNEVRTEIVETRRNMLENDMFCFCVLLFMLILHTVTQRIMKMFHLRCFNKDYPQE